jgi:four helix bundle protein
VQDYHQLDIWHRAMDYAVSVYHFSAQLPLEERFNLASQLRRAAVSVPLNIAEGSGCGTTNGEFARFVGYAYRSLKEVVTCVELTQRLHPVAPEVVATLVDEGNQIARMTYTFMQRLAPSHNL